MVTVTSILDFLKTRGRILGVELAGFLTLVTGYLGFSLFDPWARLSPFIHVLAFILLLGLGFFGIASRLNSGQGRHSFPWVRLVIFVPLLLLGLYNAGDDAKRRIYVGLTPAYITSDPVMRLDVTITPPGYTGLKPVVLARYAQTPSVALLNKTPITVPAGSIISVTSEGKGFQPSLAWGHSVISLRPLGQGKFRVAGKILDDTQVEIREGSKRLAVWPLVVTADHPPSIRLAGGMRFTERQSLKFQVVAKDDYGVSYIGLKISLKDDEGLPAKFIELPSYGAREINELQYTNLLSHPWAGKKVTANLVVVDGAGQTAESAPFDITLPATQFHNSFSQSLVGVRRNILAGGEGIDKAAQSLEALLSGPDQSMLDITTYLGLRTAYSRLDSDLPAEGRHEIASLLWDLAVRDEDGGLSNARDDLSQALDKLRFAVKKSAPKDEVNALVGAFSWSLRAYDDNRRKAGVRSGGNAGHLTAQDLEDGLDWQALTNFLNREVDLVGKGNYVKVSSDLDALKEGLEERGDLLLSAGVYRRFLVAGYALQKLNDVKKRQHDLLLLSNNPANSPLANIRADQKALRDDLVAMIPQLEGAGISHDAFEAAGLAMNKALVAGVRKNMDETALAQGQSLAALQRASAMLAKIPSPVGKDWAGGELDPLGRPLPFFIFKQNTLANTGTAAKEQIVQPGQIKR